MQITVRTWHSVKNDSEQGYGTQAFLERVELPDGVVMRIFQWAKDYQVGLLTRKYKRAALGFVESQKQEHLVAMNRLYKQLQGEGFASEKERLAISFLFGQYRDNPELIDLQVASQFLADIEQQTA